MHATHRFTVTAIGSLVLAFALYPSIAAAQTLPAPHRTTVGVLYIRYDPDNSINDEAELADLNYRDPATGLPFVYRVGGITKDIYFLEEGAKYSADIWVENGNYPHLNIEFGGGHFADQVGILQDLRGCRSLFALAQALKRGSGFVFAKCDSGNVETGSIEWKDPEPVEKMDLREQFKFYVAAYDEVDSDIDDTNAPDFRTAADSLRHDHDEDSLFGKLAQLAQQLQPPPTIPEGARKVFIEGATKMKQGNYSDAWMKFDDSIRLAPWWADAHYNDAVAKEKYGLYDGAAKELKRYLLLNPAPADAREAQDRIYAIAVEKEGGEKRAEENYQQQLTKYVAGGAQRVCRGFNGGNTNTPTPSAWEAKDGRLGIVGTYIYNEDWYCFGNVFKMPNGHYLAAALAVQSSSDGRYAGDEVDLADLTESGSIRVKHFPFGTLNGSFDPSGGGSYKVSISDLSSTGVISITDRSSGAGFILPLSDLYVSRYGGASNWTNHYTRIGDTDFKIGYLPGTNNGYYAVFFRDPLKSVDGLGLTPTYVVPLGHGDQPISNTGYFIRYQGTSWEVQK